MKNFWKQYITKILPSLVWYLVWAGVFWWMWSRQARRLLLILVALVIKDITQYAIQLTPMTTTSYDLTKIKQWYMNQKISSRYYLAFVNRIYFFPFILTVYLIYLLIQQTQLRDLHLSVRYLLLDETVLLVITIVSGLWLVYQDDQDTKYKKTTTSLTASYMYYYFSALLGLLSTYIIYLQVSDLWAIGATISVIAGVLVFLVGVLLLEDDDQ